MFPESVGDYRLVTASIRSLCDAKASVQQPRQHRRARAMCARGRRQIALCVSAILFTRNNRGGRRVRQGDRGVCVTSAKCTSCLHLRFTLMQRSDGRPPVESRPVGGRHFVASM